MTQKGALLEFNWIESAVSEWWRSVIAQGGSWQQDQCLVADSLERDLQRLSQLTHVDPQFMDSTFYNDLHHQFEQVVAQGLLDDHWSEINLLIHSLEHQGSHNLQMISVSRRPDIREPIPPDWQHLWAHRPSQGDLCLGYFTVGKNISSCYRDRDWRMIQQGLVTAQTDLHSQGLLIFHTSGPPHQQRWNDRLDSQIQQWVQHLGSVQDLSQPPHRYHGQPLMARCVSFTQMIRFRDSLRQGDLADHWELA